MAKPLPEGIPARGSPTSGCALTFMVSSIRREEKGEEEVSFLLPHGENSAFRCMVLYFVRQGLRVLENQLYAYYQSQSDQVRKKRRQSVRDAMQVCVEGKKMTEDQKKNWGSSLHDRDKNSLYDFSLRYGLVILRNLEEGEKNRLRNYFVEELRYADLESFEEWWGWINSLKEVRDYLEHYEERKAKGGEPKGLEEEEFFRRIGRIVLPKLAGLLEGQLKSKRWQKGYARGEEEKRDWQRVAGVWEEGVREGRRSRKEARRQYQNAVRTRKNVETGRRQKLANENEAFRMNYLAWFPDVYQRGNAYRLENLRDYHFALGGEMLRRLNSEGGCGSFSEVEELYSLHHELGLRISWSLEYLQSKWLGDLGEKGVDLVEFDDVMKATFFYEKHGKTCGDALKYLRNDIAHGRMAFMGVWEESMEEAERIEEAAERREEEGEEEKAKVLRKTGKLKRKTGRRSRERAENYFFGVLMALRYEGEEAEYDRLYSDISNVLKKAKRMEVWTPEKEGRPMRLAMTPLVWKDEKRETLGVLRRKYGEGVKVVRYEYVRKQAGMWKKNLRESHKRVMVEFS